MNSSHYLKAILIYTVLLCTNAQLKPKGPPPPPINLNLPPIGGGSKPFGWSGKGLTGKNGVNGFSLTGKWKPPGSGHSFSGTGSWQNGKGFGGSLGGSFGIGGGGTKLTFKFGGGGGKGTSGSIGVMMPFRKRRSVLEEALRA